MYTRLCENADWSVVGVYYYSCSWIGDQNKKKRCRGKRRGTFTFNMMMNRKNVKECKNHAIKPNNKKKHT